MANNMQQSIKWKKWAEIYKIFADPKLYDLSEQAAEEKLTINKNKETMIV